MAVQEQSRFRAYRFRGKAWRLLWLRSGDAPGVALERGDTVLAEAALSQETLATFRNRRVYWLDLGSKTRSREGSPLTEELALYLGRYGVRLARDA